MGAQSPRCALAAARRRRRRRRREVPWSRLIGGIALGPAPPQLLCARASEGACPGAVRRPGGGASALGIHGDRTRPALAAAMAVPLGAAPASWLLWLSFREPRGCRGARRVQVTLRGWGGVGAGAREPRQE